MYTYITPNLIDNTYPVEVGSNKFMKTLIITNYIE